MENDEKDGKDEEIGETEWYENMISGSQLAEKWLTKLPYISRIVRNRRKWRGLAIEKHEARLMNRDNGNEISLYPRAR